MSATFFYFNRLQKKCNNTDSLQLFAVLVQSLFLSPVNRSYFLDLTGIAATAQKKLTKKLQYYCQYLHIKGKKNHQKISSVHHVLQKGNHPGIISHKIYRTKRVQFQMNFEIWVPVTETACKNKSKLLPHYVINKLQYHVTCCCQDNNKLYLPRNLMNVK